MLNSLLAADRHLWGYRPVGDVVGDHAEFFHTLGHWLLAYRFEHIPPLREKLLRCHRLRDAYRECRSSWSAPSPSWLKNKEKALYSGLILQELYHPGTLAEICSQTPLPSRKSVVWPDDELEASWPQVLTRIEQRARSQLMKVMITGDKAMANETWLRECLFKLFSKKRPDVIVTGGTGGAEVLAEQWARRQLIPVQLVRVSQMRGRADLDHKLQMMLSTSSHVVLFRTKSSVWGEKVATAVKGTDIPLRSLPLEPSERKTVKSQTSSTRRS